MEPRNSSRTTVCVSCPFTIVARPFGKLQLPVAAQEQDPQASSRPSDLSPRSYFKELVLGKYTSLASAFRHMDVDHSGTVKLSVRKFPDGVERERHQGNNTGLQCNSGIYFVFRCLGGFYSQRRTLQFLQIRSHNLGKLSFPCMLRKRVCFWFQVQRGPFIFLVFRFFTRRSSPTLLTTWA